MTLLRALKILDHYNYAVTPTDFRGRGYKLYGVYHADDGYYRALETEDAVIRLAEKLTRTKEATS